MCVKILTFQIFPHIKIKKCCFVNINSRLDGKMLKAVRTFLRNFFIKFEC